MIKSAMTDTSKPDRISLAEVSRETGAVLARGRFGEWDEESRTPSLRDLTERLYFSPGDGRIWLNNDRMVLLHASQLGSLRRELMSALDAARCRGLLTRVGYLAGARAATLIREQ